jgi:hypothetical protein
MKIRSSRPLRVIGDVQMQLESASLLFVVVVLQYTEEKITVHHHQSVSHGNIGRNQKGISVIDRSGSRIRIGIWDADFGIRDPVLFSDFRRIIMEVITKSSGR